MAFGYLGSWSAKVCRVIQWSCRGVSPSWAAGCPELRRGLAKQQAGESVLGSLFREARRSGEAAGE